jgi:hypothetical protein
MIYVTYCHISELEGFNPILAQEIIKMGPTERLPLVEPPFVYAFKQSGYVWRMDFEDYNLYGFSRSLTENPYYQERIRLARSQQRLPETIAKITTKEDT